MEVRDTSSYESILRLVANGVNQNSKLSDKSGFSTSLTSAILSNLEKLEIVKNETPLLTNKRKSHYLIADPLFNFYYKFVSHFNTMLEFGKFDGVKSYFINNFPTFLGYRFEEIYFQYMIQTIDIPSSVGKWWGPNPQTHDEEEIDIVVVTIDKTIHFAECKFQNQPISEQVLETLQRRSYLADSSSKREFWLFSKSGFTPNLKTNLKLHLIDLEELSRVLL